MSRSWKKAIVWVSKARDKFHRRRERHRVKQELSYDFESDFVNRDPKELGKDEWGTWCGLEFDDIEALEHDLDRDYSDEKKKMSRK
jgi:hypothetical protein